MRKKSKKTVKTLPAKKVSGRKAAKVRGGSLTGMALSLANKQQRGGTNDSVSEDKYASWIEIF